MMKLEVVDVAYCENMPLVRCFHTGSWVNSYAELFAPAEGAEPTHLHIYDRGKAVEAYRLGKMVLPATVKTVSYAK